MELPEPVVSTGVKTVVWTVVLPVMVVETMIGPTVPLLELDAVPDAKVGETEVKVVFDQDEGTDSVGLLHGVDKLDWRVLAPPVLRGTEPVPDGEPVPDWVTVITETDSEVPDGAPLVSHIVDKLNELVNDHVRLPALTLVLGPETGPEVVLEAGRGLRVTVTTVGAAVPEPLGLMTVPERVSVALRAVGKGGLLAPGVCVGTPVQESQVVLNPVTGGRDDPWVPVKLLFQEGTDWLGLLGCDPVGAVFQTVEVTTWPDGVEDDDHDPEVVLLNGGSWLFVTVSVVSLNAVCETPVEMPEPLPVGADPVVKVMTTTVPAGCEVAVELLEPGLETVIVLTIVCPVAVVFQGN